MDVSFRMATPDDVGAVRALVESAYRGSSARRGWTHEAHLLSGERTSDAEVAAQIGDPGHHMILAEAAGPRLSIHPPGHPNPGTASGRS